jgi:hypothetical protein
MSSIFTNPYKYRQSEKRNELENYLTEIFAGVLRKDDGLMSKFCELINCGYDKIKDNVIIRTQHSRTIDDKKFRPDIQIEIGEHSIILIENKVDSFERTDQLNDYCKVLDNQKVYSNKFLVYITKFFEAKSIEEESEIVFKEIIWSKISEICVKESHLAKELSLFIIDKKINMEGTFTYLDALVLENMKEVFEKLDHVLNAAHNYHKSPAGLNIRLDKGKSIGSIKTYGYYTLGDKDNIEYVIGFFGNPIELIYRLQGNAISSELRNKLSLKGWKERINDGQIQLDKSQRLSKFMTDEGDEIGLMIDFLKNGILEVRNE